MFGLLGGGGKGPPAMTREVDNKTSDLIKDYSTDALDKSSGDLYGEYMQGVGSGIDVGPKGFAGQSGVGMGAMSDAISRRALRGHRADTKQLKNDVMNTAIESRMSRLLNASQLANQEHQQNKMARMNKWIQKQNRRSARGAVLGNVLGIAGAVGGGMMGGVAGAGAGYQLGQGTGNMFGGA